MVVLLSVWHVSEDSHDSDRYLNPLVFREKLKHPWAYQLLIKGTLLTLKNCLNAGHVL